MPDKELNTYGITKEKGVTKEAEDKCWDRNRKIRDKNNSDYDFAISIKPFEEFLGERMQQFEVVDKRKSLKLAKKWDCIIKACHDNVTTVVVKEWQENKKQYKYFMGWCISKKYGIQSHSWIVNDLGQVVDPTLSIPRKVRLKKDGTIVYKVRGVKDNQSPLYEDDFDPKYFGIEIPLRTVFSIADYSSRNIEHWQHRYIYEVFLLHLGMPLSEVCIETGSGEEGMNKFKAYFKKAVEDHV
jgi:hypothetical protein